MLREALTGMMDDRVGGVVTVGTVCGFLEEVGDVLVGLVRVDELADIVIVVGVNVGEVTLEA